jgi:selenide,water dikinase
LAAALDKLPRINDPRVLVGFNTSDDAGVVRLTDSLALVQTVDFFTPIVDDPFCYGQIAAANALSDVYAMGGKPYCALNIVGFPKDLFPLDVLAAILAGGQEKATEAGVVIVGGHTISDNELKYGMAVTGLIHPDHILTNANARVGDLLYLTKPIGTGTITTQLKAGKGDKEMVERACQVMGQLNKAASEVCLKVGVHSCTDVTGFGLLGHGLEMAEASKVAFELWYDQIPVLAGTLESVQQSFVPGGTRANRLHVEPNVRYAEHMGDHEQFILNDPQTSGGLLIAVPADKQSVMESALEEAGLLNACIGKVIQFDGAHIRVM